MIKNEKFAFFLPTRKGSERVQNKNTRTFAGIEGGLLKLKLNQLLEIDRVHDIIVSTNDPETIEIAQSFNNDRIQVIERPEALCLSSTVIEDFINYIPTVVNADHIFWVHATAPFADKQVLENALDVYEKEVIGENNYDSLLSVTKVQQFLWSAKENKCINHDREQVKWPRTQDLEPLYEINHAFYINSRENYLKFNDRIGVKPYLYELDKIHSFDIDWNDDFQLAEIIYNSLYAKNKVVTFGEIMVRLGAPDYLKLIQSNSLDVSYAGAEANVAVSLAHYGISTDYITCLPENPIAEHCIMELRGHRVGVDHIQRSGKRMGILYLETGSNMRPSKVFYDREYSSIAMIEPGSINWYDILKDATWFHWTGITPALSQNAADECLKAVQVANELGVTVSCDINYRGNLWNYGKNASEVMPALVEGCDLIMGNEEDCEKVFGIKPKNFDADNTQGSINQRTFESVCLQMMARFHRCKKMAVTLRGAINANHNTWCGILYDGKQLYQSARYDITDIVDRVGGGDSFMGGLIYGLLHYGDNQKALDFATAASAYKHTLKGDFNWATVDDVEALMSGNVSGRVKR